jgi:hypothetical protein
MKRVFGIAALSVLFGCGPMPHIKQEHEGLNRLSYGRLVNYVDKDTGDSITPPLCDPDAKFEDVRELSRKIVGYLFRPVAGATTIDPTIKDEDLQSSFLAPGDFGRPNVVLLERSPDRITFWYHAELVTLPEVMKAANVFCDREHMQPIYEGSSRKCSEPKPMLIAVNGKQTSINTTVISTFQCAIPTGAPYVPGAVSRQKR